jgi:GAF domain-containing protein
MQTDHIPADDLERLGEVRRYEILDTPADGAFDRITTLAARLFNVPIAIVSIVDEDRIWFKSHHGIDAEETGRDAGLCASAVCQNEPWIVNDAKVDPRTLTNPLVVGELGLRFYAGIPLTTADGYNLGTMNVIDKEPREFSASDTETLKDLAAIVVHELELRLALRNYVRDRRAEALDLQDSVVQRLAVAQMAMDLGHIDQQRDAIMDSMRSARSAVTKLLEESDAMGDFAPGSFVRPPPDLGRCAT